ncbi:hypothetical protein CspeluHIS016_0100100 [Cutaneotrichosporon spelunceum]|uniref:Trypsin-like serine protease n=1 Tax=Cutaneotrichosporon spelunceum TaxID=1672016 RepID=A0AAD3Y988_9TREE|nr:hypothetical protein CspeluHIS016_0100100 [Cutaneotrichosporon spelunceum]
MSETKRPSTPPAKGKSKATYPTSPSSSPTESPPRTQKQFDELLEAYAGAFTDFYGLPSNPICLYKTGQRFRHLYGHGEFKIPRMLAPVVSHPIADNWDEIVSEIATHLDANKVDWTSIDPVRFKEQVNALNGPPQALPELYIWIGVEPLSLTPAKAKDVAHNVKAILVRWQHGDVEVALRESTLHRHMLPVVDDVRYAKEWHPFTSAIGVYIGNSLGLEGTGAVYYHMGNKMMLLTAAHVIRPPIESSYETVYQYKNPSQPKMAVVVPGKDSYESATAAVMDKLEHVQDAIEHTQWSLTRSIEEQAANQPLGQGGTPDVYESLLKVLSADLATYKELHAAVCRLKQDNLRTLGHVSFADQIIYGDKPHGYTRDWGLVEIAPGNLDLVSSSPNKIYIGDIDKVKYIATMFPRGDDRGHFVYPKSRFLPVHGIVPKAELSCPTHLILHDDKILYVVKNGRATGTTMGAMNGLESRTRTKLGHGAYQSMELMVMTIVADITFSKRGDSGAAVVDRNGRLVGLLTAGGGARANTDVTYLTPFWWLNSVIKNKFPAAHLCK